MGGGVHKQKKKKGKFRKKKLRTKKLLGFCRAYNSPIPLLDTAAQRLPPSIRVYNKGVGNGEIFTNRSVEINNDDNNMLVLVSV